MSLYDPRGPFTVVASQDGEKRSTDLLCSVLSDAETMAERWANDNVLVMILDRRGVALVTFLWGKRLRGDFL